MSQKKFLKIAAVFLATASGSACSTNGIDRPVYEDVGIRLSGQLAGVVSLNDGCFAIVADDDPVLLIFPDGTKFRPAGFTLPDENGGISISVGDEVKSFGGYLSLNGEGNEGFQKTKCRGSAFLVNSMEKINAD